MRIFFFLFPFKVVFFSIYHFEILYQQQNVYIYIVIHRQIVLSYHNSSVWPDMQDTSRWDWNLPNFMPGLVSNCLAIQATYISLGIITLYISFHLFTFCAAGYCNGQFIKRTLHYKGGSCWFLCQHAQPPGEEHIYCHSQTNCFILSDFFSMNL